MDDVYISSATDCNGVSGGSREEGMSHTDAFIYIQYMFLMCTAHACIVGVLVQAVSSRLSNTFMYIVMYMWNTY